MPANFLEIKKIKMPFTEYMSLIEQTSLKGLFRRAAEQKAENKIRKLVEDYKNKVEKDKGLLSQIEELPVVSDNPSPVIKEVNVEQEFLEKQPLILRDAPFNKAITADVKSFCSCWFDLSEPEKYKEILSLINKDLEKEGEEIFDVSTKENLILGLANRYAQNAMDARALRKWREYNFYMRSLAYFVTLLLAKANSKSLEDKVENIALACCKSKVQAADVSYKELVDELSEQFEIVRNNLKRIEERFKYRMLINVSYPLDRANKIEDEIYKELDRINKDVSKLWNKIG